MFDDNQWEMLNRYKRRVEHLALRCAAYNKLCCRAAPFTHDIIFAREHQAQKAVLFSYCRCYSLQRAVLAFESGAWVRFGKWRDVLAMKDNLMIVLTKKFMWRIYLQHTSIDMFSNYTDSCIIFCAIDTACVIFMCNMNDFTPSYDSMA